MKNKIATTVKIDNGLYDQFKVLGIRYRITLQSLVEKCVFRYVNDESFRSESINNYTIPQVAISGSYEQV
jgi:hypothetical protein